jgi:enhancing lycopene biosynthesis protein 2
MRMKKIGVLLSGCGVRDGSEIHEATCTILALVQQGAEPVFIAPDGSLNEVNHLTGEATGKQRNILVESARIARGSVTAVSEVSADQLDGIIIPGGFGAALNLSNFAVAGAAGIPDPSVASLIQSIHAQNKPVGAICIAPATLALILGPTAHPTVTIGTDSATAAEITKTGAVHQDCSATDCVVDTDHKIVTTPAYMLATDIAQVFTGISKAVSELLKMC